MPRYPNERTDPKNLDYGGLKDDPYEEELVGAPPLEEEPVPADILPDQIQQFQGKPADEDEEEITARPREDIHPIPPSELPEG